LLLSSALALPVSGCGGLFPKRYRFRMTVEVETPEGLKTGSSVMEVSAYKVVRIMSEERAGGGSFHGEAVTVDLPAGPLFVLLIKSPRQQPSLEGDVARALLPGANIQNVDDYVAAVAKLGTTRAHADLPRGDWPMMVRFKDINNPKTVEVVDAPTIGVGRIRLETTSDPVTSGIKRRLRWLVPKDRESSLDEDFTFTTKPTLAQSLRHSDFRQGTEE
jgi:hypothetical protein